MSVTVNEFAVGKCFLSNMSFVRRVLAVEGDRIVFEERGTKPVPLPWERKKPVAAEKFAADVIREVPEDFDSEAPDDEGKTSG